MTAGSSSAQPEGAAAQGPTVYVEIVRPAWWAWLLAALFAVSMGIVFLPVHPLAGLGGLAAAALLVVFALVRWTLRCEVKDGVLRVGRAHVGVDLVGEVRALDEAAMRSERGPRLDARAFLALRGWVPTGVRVALRDPDDPTPYWLISSRHPDAFAAAVRAAARAGRSVP